jgi:hypothetical protein
MSHIGFDINEYGTRISKHRCDTCGVDFSLCPAVEGDVEGKWGNCLAPHCASYDATRDVDLLFDADSNVTSLHGLMDDNGSRIRPVKAKREWGGDGIVTANLARDGEGEG